jgi:6-pyruvoyltetrahydropterin/6-carboxytetrahydropterin synthase
VFQSELDSRNWVVDFGCFKSNGFKQFMNFWFDHTTIIAADDPHRAQFDQLEKKGLIQLRILEHVGCEKFAEFVFNALVEQFKDTAIKVVSVECFEHQSNSAIYEA